VGSAATSAELKAVLRRTASQQLDALQEADGLGPVPELGDRDGVRLQLGEGRLGLNGRYARGERVLVAGRAGDDLLALT
jgi:hypothetical protein